MKRFLKDESGAVPIFVAAAIFTVVTIGVNAIYNVTTPVQDTCTITTQSEVEGGTLTRVKQVECPNEDEKAAPADNVS